MLSDLFSELSLAQWIFIGLGILLVLPSVVGFFGSLKDKIVPDSKPNPVISKDGHTLTDIVCKWECLYEACKSSELEAACSKIEEVFPLLTKKKPDEPTVPSDI